DVTRDLLIPLVGITKSLLDLGHHFLPVPFVRGLISSPDESELLQHVVRQVGLFGFSEAKQSQILLPIDVREIRERFLTEVLINGCIQAGYVGICLLYM